DFAEDAPPDYFYNAAPSVPRPARATFEVVSPARYKELQDKNELWDLENKKVRVTQDMLDKVFKNTTSETPTLEPGRHLKLVNTELYQSINAGFVILFTPLLVGFFAWLRGRGLEPSTPAKLGFGLLLTAGGVAVMLGATMASSD